MKRIIFDWEVPATYGDILELTDVEFEKWEQLGRPDWFISDRIDIQDIRIPYIDVLEES